MPRVVFQAIERTDRAVARDAHGSVKGIPFENSNSLPMDSVRASTLPVAPTTH